MRNIETLRPVPHSAFRKLAIGSWSNPTDPKVYTKLKCEVSTVLNYLDSNSKYRSVTLTHFFTKLMAELLKRFPEINSVLIRNKLYYRKSINAFIHTHISTHEGYDLRGICIEDVDTLSVNDISKITVDESRKLRQNQHDNFRKSSRILSFVPLFLIKLFVKVLDFLFYTCNLKLPGLPRDLYGSFAVTTVGALGFEEAYVPLFPFSRLGLVLSVGKVYEEYVYDGKEHQKCKFVNLCFTMDHRYFDGAHFAKPLRLLKKILKNPSLIKF